MSTPTYPVLLYAVEVTTGVNDTIIYNDGTADRTATIAAGTYYLGGVGGDGDLLDAVETALEGAPSSALTAWTVTLGQSIDATSLASYVLLSAGGPFTLKVSGTFDLDLLGFTAQQASTSDQVLSDASCACAWVSTQPYDTKEPAPRRTVEQHETPEQGTVYTFALSDVRRDRSLVMNLISGKRALKERNTSDEAATFEAWWETASDGRGVEFHLPAIDSGTTLAALTSSTRVCLAVLHVDTCRAIPLRLTRKGQALYGGEVKVVETSS